MSWILILYIYAGPFSKYDHVALTSVSGFKSLAACQKAGEQTKVFTDGFSLKESKYICVSAD